MRSGVGVFRVGDDIPFGIAGFSRFVSAPADVLATENDSLRGQFVNQFFPGRVVISLSAFALGMCTVKPYFVNGTILGEQLEQLVHEIFIIVIKHEPESGFVGERTSGYFPRNGALGVWTQVAIETLRMFYLV